MLVVVGGSGRVAVGGPALRQSAPGLGASTGRPQPMPSTTSMARGPKLAAKAARRAASGVGGDAWAGWLISMANENLFLFVLVGAGKRDDGGAVHWTSQTHKNPKNGGCGFSPFEGCCSQWHLWERLAQSNYHCSIVCAHYSPHCGY